MSPIALAAGVGAVGWGGNAHLLPVSMVFPLLWSRAPTRTAAVLVSASYFLAASHGLPQGVAQFFATDLWLGLVFWIAAATSFVFLHALLWTGGLGAGKAVRYLAILVLTALPPFGITGWAHPLTATGILLPGCGWWGLVAAMAGLIALVTRIGPAIAVAIGGMWVWSAAWQPPAAVMEGWRGVDLQMGASLGRDASLSRHRELIAIARSDAAAGVRVVVLPESSLGFWTPTTERLWVDGLRETDVTVVAGAAVVGNDGYDNVMVAIDAGGARILYRERMPVPISMWRPWERWTGAVGGARADFFANPVVDVAGRKIAPIICYEQLVLWPVVHSLLYRPDAIVLIGNGWWTTDGNIVAIQRASANAWARLFGLPVIISFNT